MMIWSIFFSEFTAKRTSRSYFWGLFLFYSLFTKKFPFAYSGSSILSVNHRNSGGFLNLYRTWHHDLVGTLNWVYTHTLQRSSDSGSLCCTRSDSIQFGHEIFLYILQQKFSGDDSTKMSYNKQMWSAVLFRNISSVGQFSFFLFSCFHPMLDPCELRLIKWKTSSFFVCFSHAANVYWIPTMCQAFFLDTRVWGVISESCLPGRWGTKLWKGQEKKLETN